MESQQLAAKTEKGLLELMKCMKSYKVTLLIELLSLVLFIIIYLNVPFVLFYKICIFLHKGILHVIQLHGRTMMILAVRQRNLAALVRETVITMISAQEV